MNLNRRGLLISASAFALLAASPVLLSASSAKATFLRVARGGGGGGGGGSVPASIATPVSGTDLTSVWNLKVAGATGPRFSATNGAWAGRTPAAQGQPTGDAYLDSLGVVIGSNNGSGPTLYWDIGSSTKTLEKYDFSGAPPLFINGTGTANVNDNLFWTADDTVLATMSGLVMNFDGNGNISTATTTLTVNMNYCTFDKATCYQGAGTWTFSYCRIKNQVRGFANSAFGGTGIAVFNYDHCYITGCGVHPTDASNHIEISQMGRSASGSSFSCTNTFVDISQDGQTTAAAWGSGWTAVWAVVGDYPSTFTNCIMIGAIAVNAQVANPNVVSCIIGYNTGSTPTLTNCVMEQGVNGYTLNQNSTGTRPTDGGGNRSYANVAITSGQFG
jgi:hypothetical protein